MSEPIKPEDAPRLHAERIPPQVVEIFNELIAKNWNGRYAFVMQEDAVQLIVARMKVERRKIFDEGWLDVEYLFGTKGWKVEYDKPAYNESYDPRFTFQKA